MQFDLAAIPVAPPSPTRTSRSRRQRRAGHGQRAPHHRALTEEHGDLAELRRRVQPDHHVELQHAPAYPIFDLTALGAELGQRGVPNNGVLLEQATTTTHLQDQRDRQRQRPAQPLVCYTPSPARPGSATATATRPTVRDQPQHPRQLRRLRRGLRPPARHGRRAPPAPAPRGVRGRLRNCNGDLADGARPVSHQHQTAAPAAWPAPSPTPPRPAPPAPARGDLRARLRRPATATRPRLRDQPRHRHRLWRLRRACALATPPRPARRTCALAPARPLCRLRRNVGTGCETQPHHRHRLRRCGVTCALANASSTCAGGACALVACAPGFFDCDGKPRHTAASPRPAGTAPTAAPAPTAPARCARAGCARPSCSDGLKNGSETGVACGGTCAACPPPCTPEVCDGVDSDCDGVIDNGNPGGGVACNSGPCGAGITLCSNGALTCVPASRPRAARAAGGTITPPPTARSPRRPPCS